LSGIIGIRLFLREDSSRYILLIGIEVGRKVPVLVLDESVS
jgi:hypothetical protein